MKRIIYLLSILLLISSFGGCSDGNSTKNVNTSTLGKTGQIISYTNFDDGYYKKGVEKVYIRDDKNGVITDNLSTLMWQDDVEPTTLGVYWYEARKYCSNLTLASHSDWRLPTRKELHSIVDYGKYNPSISNTFKNFKTYNNWTSTELATDRSQVWVVSFISGDESFAYKDGVGNVRCVRDNK